MANRTLRLQCNASLLLIFLGYHTAVPSRSDIGSDSARLEAAVSEPERVPGDRVRAMQAVHRSALRRCYLGSERRAPSLPPKLTVRADVAPDGTVSRAQVLPEAGARLVECLQQVVGRFRFTTHNGPRWFSFPILVAGGMRH